MKTTIPHLPIESPVRNLLHLFAAIWSAFACVLPAAAQSALDGFDPNANDTVYAMVVQPDGKIVVGGAFTEIAGYPVSYLARLNPDGTLDPSLYYVQPDGTVFALALQADGKILVGGRFTELGGQPRAGIGRLNANGSVDASFNPGADRLVLALAVQSDGMIVVGGQFRTLGGQPRDHIGRLGADGRLDGHFNPGANGQVNTLALQPDGKILVGGVFTQLAGQTRNRIGRLDARGLADSFNPGADDTVECLLLQVDGKIVVGGRFGMLGGAERKLLGRLNSNGSVDTALSFGADGWVYSLVRQADGKILVGGDFTELGGGTRARLGRLNFNGTLDTTFNPGANGVVRALAVQPDGSVLVGGEFTTLGGQTRNRIGRLYAGGALDATLDVSIISPLSLATVVVQADGKILLGGSFTSVGGQSRSNLARLNPDGTLDTGFNPVVDGGVGVLAVQGDGKILVAGSFTAVGGTPRARLARLNSNGSLDSGFDPNPSHLPDWSPMVNCLAVQADGAIVVGGKFIAIGGESHTNIARLDPRGIVDSSFNAVADLADFPALGSVDCLAIQADGKIVMGGNFDQVCGVARDGLARLNASGTLDSQVNLQLNGSVMCLAVQPDGKILVGGLFGEIGGEAHSRLARLNASGSLDWMFRSGVGTFGEPFTAVVRSLAVQADGKILIGGEFRQLNSQFRRNLGRLDAAGNVDYDFNPGANYAPMPDAGDVWGLAIQPDGKILVCGLFTTLGGQPRNGLGRLISYSAVSQRLSVPSCGSAITWQRGGSAPEIEQVRFLGSLDGVGWTWLGPGSKIDGGWQLTGLSLPAGTNYFIRAQGFPVGGSDMDSSGLIESTLLYYDASHADATAPVAGTDECLARAGYEKTIPVLANDTDAENDPLFILSVTNGLHGTATLANQIVTYTSENNYTGPDSFTYLLTDGCWTTTGIVNVVVGKPPAITAYPAFRSVLPGATVTFSVTATGSPSPDYLWGVWRTPAAGSALTNDARINGVTTPSLTLSNVQFADSGVYQVALSNSFGLASASAALTVASVAALEDFNPGAIGAYGEVRALAVQPDGRILVAGNFTKLGGQNRSALGRLHADGTLDASFNPAVAQSDWYPTVRCVALQADGKVIVGGTFDLLGGQPRQRLGRFNANGSLDTSFSADAADPSSPEFASVQCLAVQADGKILVGGEFSTLRGVARNRIGRLEASGNVDTGFNPGADRTVYSLAVQADGKILLGGEYLFHRLNPDGSLDTAFNPVVGGWVHCIAVQPDGRILVGGDFTSAGGQNRRSLARLNADGSVDAAFNPGAEGTEYPTVYTVSLQCDGKILVAGNFTSLGGQFRAYLGRLTADGSLDPAWNPGANGWVYAAIPLVDGKILVGGSISQLGGRSRLGIGLLPSDGAAWQDVGVSSDGTMATWARGGAAPEVEQVTFAQSADGTNFSQLGNAERIPGGWRLEGQSFPVAQTFHLRAQGRTAGGYANSSSGLVASTNAFYATAYVNRPPLMRSAAPSGNSVLVQFEGEGGRTYRIQHAPAATGSYTNLPGMFVVPAGTKTAACTHTNGKAGAGFYRVVSQ